MNILKQHGLDLIMLIVMFFAPVQAALISVGVLCTFDAITGIMAAKKRGELITSNKGFRTIIKMIIYSILVICSHLIEVVMIDFIPVTKIATSAIALIELKSLYENASTILGIDMWKFIKQIMDKKGIDLPEIPTENNKN